VHMRRRLRFAIVVAAALTPLFGLTGRSAERDRARPAAYSFESVEIPTPPLGGLKLPNSALEPIDWDALIGWAVDDHAAAFATFLSSCRPLLKTVLPLSDMRPMYSALKRVCHQALAAGPLTDEQARVFFENTCGWVTLADRNIQGPNLSPAPRSGAAFARCGPWLSQSRTVVAPHEQRSTSAIL
jgi:hypothetical protein